MPKIESSNTEKGDAMFDITQRLQETAVIPVRGTEEPETREETPYGKLFQASAQEQSAIIELAKRSTQIPVRNYREAVKATFLNAAAVDLATDTSVVDPSDSELFALILARANSERRALDASNDLLTIARLWRPILKATYQSVRTLRNASVAEGKAIAERIDARKISAPQQRARRGNAEHARACKSAYAVVRVRHNLPANAPLTDELKAEAMSLLTLTGAK